MSAAGSDDGGVADVLLAGFPRDPFAGDPFAGYPAWDDPLVDDGAGGEVVLRGGVLTRVVVEDKAPGGAFDEPYDEAWYRNTTSSCDPDQSPGPQRGTDADRDPGLVLPPAGVPVVLWPETVLRHALQDTPGVRLARVVAEAIDLDHNLHDGAHAPAPTGESADRPTDKSAGGLARVPASGHPDEDAVVTDRLGDLSDDALGDLAAACGRLQSWAAGVQARVVAERAGRETHPLAHSSLVGQVTAELVVTEKEATEVVVRAESGTQHPTVIAALLAGRIDVRKAQVLLRCATQLTVVERAEAIARYLPHASRRTWKWLQIRMLAFAKARHGAAQTAQHESGRRSVQLDRADNDMGWLTAYLPAVDAAAVWGVVDDMAHQLRHTTGEERTLSQLRADSLTGIITGRLLPANRFTTDTDDTEAGAETGTGPGSGSSVTVEGHAGTGVTANHGEHGGAEGTEDTEAGGIAGDAWNDGGTATSATANTSTETGTEIGAGIDENTDSLAACDTSNGVEGSPSDNVGDRGTNDQPNPSPDGPDGGEAPVCTCGGRAPIVQQVVQEVVQMVRVTPTRPVIRVTIPATALLGLDAAPGHLDGYGPIPADTARTIATDATWQRLLTDPATGILTDYSTTTYQPSKTLRNAIETRDGTCTFLWGCDTPATRCDLDHIQPFDHNQKNKNRRKNGRRNGRRNSDGSSDHEDADNNVVGDPGSGRGQTNAHNLHALCRKHHLLKTHAGWGIVRDPDTGITTWTTPTGRTYTRPPTVLDTHVELDQIDPDTSHDLTLHALTGQHLPRQYTNTEPGTVPTSTTDTTTGATSPTDTTTGATAEMTDPDKPPF